MSKRSLPKTPFIPKLAAAALKSLLLASIDAASLAEEIEKAVLFDFDLRLPIIVVEFLFLDKRDRAIKEQLRGVKDISEEVKQLEVKKSEIEAALSKMKKDMQAELEQKLAEGRKNTAQGSGKAFVLCV